MASIEFELLNNLDRIIVSSALQNRAANVLPRPVGHTQNTPPSSLEVYCHYESNSNWCQHRGANNPGGAHCTAHSTHVIKVTPETFDGSPSGTFRLPLQHIITSGGIRCSGA